MTTNDVESRVALHYIRTGPRGGTPLLFLHALGLDLSVWESQIAAFGADHDVIAVDLPGHGRTPQTDDAPRFAAFSDSLVQFLNGLDIAAVDVVGLSVGGMIAQTLAVRAPERVRSLTLVATSCTFPDPVRQNLRERAHYARDHGMAALAPLHVARWFPDAFRAVRPDLIDRLTKILLRQDNAFHAEMWAMVASLDVAQQLETVQCPVLVVAGQDDASASPAAGQRIVECAPDAALHVMPECGHFPPMEFPAAFNALLRAFLHRE
ncbi:alpha/beta fold hydrolase [Robbsia sp. KACC 23696]|uniref:alpha/beta fold hydrolase n=1 Tax=Robbsia sp. KACC 23696 TaxID=3149231 RepID=UPI00325C2A71